MYSVETEDEAHRLLVMACQKSNSGEFLARELSGRQTLENLALFSDRLHDMYTRHILKESADGARGGG